jgi:methyl-accepting chemotaxis protein
MDSKDKELINTLINKTDTVMKSVSELYKIVADQAEQQSKLTESILKKIESSDNISNKKFETIEDLYKQFAILQESQKELKGNIQQILNWTKMN